MNDELQELIKQLDELLANPIVDADDALEVATVAGLAYRLGASTSELADAVAWREGPGADLLEEMWVQVDLDPLLEAVDECTGGGRTEEQVEEAVYDVDDVVAAAVWCSRIELVRKAARELAGLVREVPDVFTDVAEIAGKMAGLPRVAEHLALYDYWLALADTKDLQD